jgi:DNA primase
LKQSHYVIFVSMQKLIPISEVSPVANLASIIGYYLPLHESRKVLKGRCPFHADAGQSLMVYATRNHFKCFGCGYEGGAVEFISAYEGLNRYEATERIDMILRGQVKSA